MKNFYKILTLMMITIISLTTVSCSKDKDDEPVAGSEKSLYGVWIEDTDEYPYTLTFEKNNTGNIWYEISDDTRATLTMSMNFNWSVSTSSDGSTMLNVIYTGGDQVLWSGHTNINRYILAGNTLSIVFTQNGSQVVVPFKRQ